MHKRESALENAIHKILWDFEKQTEHSIPKHLVDFYVPAKHNENKRNRKNRQILEPFQRSEKLWNMKVTVMPRVVDALGTIPKVSKTCGNWRSDKESRPFRTEHF